MSSSFRIVLASSFRIIFTHFQVMHIIIDYFIDDKINFFNKYGMQLFTKPYMLWYTILYVYKYYINWINKFIRTKKGIWFHGKK